MSQRDQIRMSADEVAALMEEQRVVICTTNGPDGWPHVMPLWYLVRDGELWAWTYAKSQKVRNLERDERVTLALETGHDYQELRGVMIKARCCVHRDLETVRGIGRELAARYGPDGAADPEMREAFERQAPKRVALQFVADSTASWDHRKLTPGG